MNANGSPGPPEADAAGLAKRATAAAPGLLVTLAVASLAGFVTIGGLLLIFDAEVYNYGPLAAYGGSSIDVLRWALLGLGPVVFALATWRLGLVGALVSLAGYVLIGTLLAWMSPLRDEPSVRLVCCDGVRTLTFFSVPIIGICECLIVSPITLIVRRIWRKSRSVA